MAMQVDEKEEMFSNTDEAFLRKMVQLYYWTPMKRAFLVSNSDQ